MSGCLALLLSLTLISSVACGDTVSNRADYPAWFWNMPRSPDADYSVGFCQPCLDNDSSAAIAASDAIWNIVRMHGLEVNFKTGSVATGSSLRHMGLDAHVDADTAAFDFYEDKYRTLDRFYSNDMLIVLVGPNDDTAFEAHYQNPSGLGEWWRDIPDGHSQDYAVGVAPAYHYESSSWNDATEKAILELASQQVSWTMGLVKYYDQALIKTIAHETKAHLTGWRTVARHYAADIGAYYVLISMPKIAGKEKDHN